MSLFDEDQCGSRQNQRQGHHEQQTSQGNEQACRSRPPKLVSHLGGKQPNLQFRQRQNVMPHVGGAARHLARRLVIAPAIYLRLTIHANAAPSAKAAARQAAGCSTAQSLACDIRSLKMSAGSSPIGESASLSGAGGKSSTRLFMIIRAPRSCSGPAQRAFQTARGRPRSAAPALAWPFSQRFLMPNSPLRK